MRSATEGRATTRSTAGSLESHSEARMLSESIRVDFESSSHALAQHTIDETHHAASLLRRAVCSSYMLI